MVALIATTPLELTYRRATFLSPPERAECSEVFVEFKKWQIVITIALVPLS